MEPTHETAPSNSELPAPVGVSDSVESSGHDTASVQELQTTQTTAPATTNAQDDAGQALQAGQQPAATQTITPAAIVATDEALIADDADLIEKEWVVRAKSLVEQTKHDPYMQNKAINQVKADYIKKRYNKDVKVSEG